MDENERKEMEKEEGKKTLLELVLEVGWVFYHPILREWVKEAPSVNSIDTFINYQFKDFEHKMELIKLMRKAVNAWKLISKENKRDYLKTPKGWRLSDMFIFGLPTDFPGQFKSSKLDFATGIKFLLDPKKSLDCSTWPIFLREFCSGEGRDAVLTSVDCWGGTNNIDNFFAPKELREEFWQGNEAEAFRGNPQDLNEMGYQLSFDEQKTDGGRPIACVNILFRYFGICTRVVRVKPEREGQYSRFYKTVCIRDKCYRDMTQVIKIWQPIDCVSSYERGKVVYSRRINLHRNLNMNLQVEYVLDKEFKLVAFPVHTCHNPYSLIGLESINTKQSLLFQETQPGPAPQKVTEAMASLYSHFLHIWKHSIKDRKVSLESILGQKMIEDPPSSLLEFFNGER